MVHSQQSFHLHTLGCPKNQVDSDKIAGTLIDDGLVQTHDASSADLVVINTCAFVEEAREESINTVLQLEQDRMPGSRIVVTGCLAERYGDELAEALPEIDQVSVFGGPVHLIRKSSGMSLKAGPQSPALALLN